MNDKYWDDSNWRLEYKDMKLLSKFQEKLLTEGAKSLSQSWILQAMYQDWMKKKGYRYPDPPDCSSSLLEWEKSIKNITRG